MGNQKQNVFAQTTKDYTRQKMAKCFLAHSLDRKSDTSHPTVCTVVVLIPITVS